MATTNAGVVRDLSGHPRYFALLDEMADLHDRKNRDYANSADPFANFRACERAGISMVDGIYSRMSDKWERITNLLAKRRRGEGPAVSDESLEDSLKDLAGYALIELIALSEEPEREPDDLRERAMAAFGAQLNRPWEKENAIY